MLQRVVDTGEGGDRVGRGAHMNATNHVADLLGAEAGVLVVNANLVGNEAVLNLIQWLPVLIGVGCRNGRVMRKQSVGAHRQCSLWPAQGRLPAVH